MDENKLFETKQMSGNIYLVYKATNSAMSAKNFGVAVLGFEACLREVAKIGLLNYDDIFIEPIEQGSIKSTFRYISKNPVKTIVYLDLIINLFNNSFQLIEKFGSNNLQNPKTEIIEQVKDKKILELCRSYTYRNGLQKIAEPLNDDNQEAKIIFDGSTLNIDLNNKYQFYTNKEETPILPELKNGETVDIDGEITRINKKLNDLGFVYKGITMNVSPIEKENNIVSFHKYIEMEKVVLRGIVIRDSDFLVPKIKVIEIKQYEDPQLSLLDQK